MTQHVDLAVVAALPEELAELEARWPGVPLDGSTHNNLAWILRHPADGVTIATACCGYRAKNIEPLLAELTAQTDARELILLGCCGALDGELAIVEPVIAEGHVGYIDGSRLAADESLTTRLAAICPGCRKGWFASSPAVLADTDAKTRCANKTGALAVEMEGVHVARAARRHDLRLGSIRWVLDTLDDALPGNVPARPAEGLELSEIMQRLVRVSEAATACIQRLFER